MNEPKRIPITPCPACKGTGHKILGVNTRGEFQLGEDCARCGRSGFVPLIDGKPCHPFGVDRDHPDIQVNVYKPGCSPEEKRRAKLAADLEAGRRQKAMEE